MQIKKWVIGVVFSLFISHANSASLWLDSVVPSVGQNSPFSIDLWMDFSADPTLGGGVALTYNPSLVDFQSFNWNLVFPTDPGFSSWMQTAPDTVEVAFGNFAGLSGPAVVGTFDFLSLSVDGLAHFDLGLAAGAFGPFVSAATYSPYPVIDVTGTSANISAVPLPAAAWLLLSGLGMMVFTARRKA